MSDLEPALATLSGTGRWVAASCWRVSAPQFVPHGLRAFAFRRIESDRMFVQDFGHLRQGGVIVSAVTSLCRVLGVTSTAEGVETRNNCDSCTARAAMGRKAFSSAGPAATHSCNCCCSVTTPPMAGPGMASTRRGANRSRWFESRLVCSEALHHRWCVRCELDRRAPIESHLLAGPD